MAVSSNLQASRNLLTDVQNSPSGSNPFLNPFSASKDPEIDHPIGRLPKELILTIFSYLNADELEKCSLICKHWKRVADTEALWKALCPKVAFGKEQWTTYFGDVGEAPSLPRKLYAYLNRPCPIWPDKKVDETHLLMLVPQTVNGQPLNLKTLGELVKKPLQGHATQYNSFYLNDYTDSPAPAAHWILMSREVIPKSTNKSYDNQKELVQGYASYEIPKVLDAAVAILGEYVRTGTRLYPDSPRTYTRCQEMYASEDNWPLAVGGFSSAGLDIGDDDGDESEISGVGVFRKF